MLIASLPLSCLWRDAKHHIPAAGQGQALWILPSKDPFVRRVSLLLLRWFSGVSSKCQSYCAPCDYQVYLWEIRTVPNWNSVPCSLLTVGRSDILWNFDGKQKLIVDVMTIEEHDSSFVITAGGALFDWWVTDLRCDNAWPDNKYIVFGDKPSTLCMLRGTRNRHSHLKWLAFCGGPIDFVTAPRRVVSHQSVLIKLHFPPKQQQNQSNSSLLRPHMIFRNSI